MSNICRACVTLHVPSRTCVCVHACVCVCAHTNHMCFASLSPNDGGQGSWLHVVTPHQRADVTVVARVRVRVCARTPTTCVLRASPPMTGGQGSWLHVVTPHQRADVTVVTCPCVIAFTCSPCTTPACRCGRADLRTMPAACLAYNHQLGALKNPSVPPPGGRGADHRVRGKHILEHQSALPVQGLVFVWH